MHCLLDNKCPIEKNFIDSWYSDVLVETCAGTYCQAIAKEFLCCSFEKMLSNPFSKANGAYQVLRCKYYNIGSIVGICILGASLVIGYVIATVVAFVSQSSVKRTLRFYGTDDL
jgi:hypothetical protein